jgi:hypothetical protein
MENLNKNWFIIFVIILVFFGLGFLFGWVLKPNNSCKTEQKHHDCMSMEAPFKMMHFVKSLSEIEGDSTKEIDIDVEVIMEELDGYISDSYDTSKSVVKIIKI